MATYDEPLIETLAFQQPQAFKALRLTVPEPELGDQAFDLKASDTGCAAYLSTSTDGTRNRVLLWEFTEEEPEVLRLSEVAQSQSLNGSALKLRFPSALHPQAVLSATALGHSLIVLSARGVLHALQLPHVDHMRDGESVLSNFLVPGTTPGGLNAIASVRLQHFAESLGAPTSLAEVDGCIAIGGRSGVVACIPKTAFGTGAPTGAFELLDSSRSLLGSFFARPPAAAVQDLAAVPGAARQEYLVAVYADNAVRIWDLRAQRRLLHDSLLPEAVGRSLVPQLVRAGAEEPLDAGVSLVVQFDPSSDAEARKLSPQVAMYRLSQAPNLSFSIGKPSGNGAAALSSLKGYVEDVLSCYDPAWGSYAWVLGGSSRTQLHSVTEDNLGGPSAVLLSGRADSEEAGTPSVQAGLWESIEAKLPGQRNLGPRHLLERLLVPGEISPKALSLTLEEFGKKVTVADLKSKSKAEIVEFLLEVIEQREAQAAMGTALQLVRSYNQSWQSLHPAYALLQHPETGTLAVVRAGPCLDPLRPGSPAESLLLDVLPDGVVALDDDDEAMDGPRTDERLVRATGILASLLGPAVVQASLAYLWHGRGYFDEVVPVLVEALTGQAQIQGDHLKTPGLRSDSAASDWRKRRRLAGMQVESLLSTIPNLPEAIEELLRDALEPPLLPHGGSKLAPEAAASNLAAFRASAAAVLEAAQGVLLLVGFLGELRTVGTWKVPEDQLQRLQHHTAGQAEAALRQAAVVEWLAVTAASGAAVSDASLELTQLHLGKGALPPRGVTSYLRYHERPLAEYFIVSPGGADDSSTPVSSMESLSTGPAPGVDFESVFLSQVLGAALQLLANRQFAPLTQLLQLASPLAANPAIKLLQGYAALGELRNSSGGGARSAKLQAALGLLFQAVACLGRRAEYLAHGDETEGKRWLQRVLAHLQRGMTGTADAENLEFEQLQALELLMMLSQQVGCLEGATSFARAAVQQALQLRSGVEGREKEQLLSREGRIWSNLFTYALDAGDFQEAYAAMEANPVASRRLDDLHSLISCLCKSRELTTLVSLPFASTVTLQRAGREQTVTLLEEAIQILKRRAESSELGASPQPYQVLADFCAAKGDWRAVAIANLAFARRLQSEGAPSPTLSTEISFALGSAWNALSLVEVRQQWLEDPGRPRKGSDTGSFGGNQADSKRESGGEQPGILTLEQLRCESQAAAVLSRWAPQSALGSLESAVGELQSLGRFEAAVELAEAVLEGQQQTSAIARALAGLASACALKQVGRRQLPSQGGQDDSFDDKSTDWERLRLLVERHLRNPGRASVLLPAVADAILAVDRRLKLPAWLQTFFLAGDKKAGMAGAPTALLRTFLKHGNLREAAAVARRFLDTWAHEVSDIDRQRALAAWFPHGLLDVLQTALSRSGDAKLRALGAAVEQDRRRLAELAKQQTDIMLSGVGAGQQASAPLPTDLHPIALQF